LKEVKSLLPRKNVNKFQYIKDRGLCRTCCFSKNATITRRYEPKEFMEQSFLVASSNFSAECLMNEITETSSTVDPIRFFQIYNRIAGMGLGISADDDGTNSSSTAYAKNLPATEFKIDTSFVADMLLESDSDMTIV